VILLTAAFATTSCGLLDDASPSESAAPTTVPADATVITMAVWGGFGLDELIAEYEAENPGVVIMLETGDYNPMHSTLQNDLVAGNGAPTIAAIGEDYISKFAAQPEQFVDLGPLGGADYKEAYLPWKWAEATGAGGEIIGLGADVAGLAMCYRTDLFAAAGLPTDRLALAGEMNDSWAGFIALGKQYEEATGNAFMDNGASLLTAMRSQQGTAYYDASGVLNPTPVKPAFDLALSAIDGGLSAGITEFSDAWDKGLTNGDFAVTLCPVWGMGYMQGVVDESNYEPKWDVADIPGEGGNWGGSFYTIPAQASPEERDAAWEFLRWLIQPDQQLKVFQATGSLPSQPSLYSDSSVTGYTIPFFNDAPVGTMLAKTVEELPVMTSNNPKNGTVEATMEQVLTEVQSGTIASTDAWAVALEAAKLVDGA
jgi:cellobiose transport system substrate-binding protein